jgi:membrane-bound lytic murein transglycosylase B
MYGAYLPVGLPRRSGGHRLQSTSHHADTSTVTSVRRRSGAVLAVTAVLAAAVLTTAALGIPAPAAATTPPPDTTGTSRSTPGTAAEAQAEADAAARRVAELTDRYTQVSAQAASTAAELAAAFAEVAAADRAVQVTRERLQAARDLQATQTRSLYAVGGDLGVVMTVLVSDSPEDALWWAQISPQVESSVTSATDRAVLAADRAALAATDRAEERSQEAARLSALTGKLRDQRAEAESLLVRAEVEVRRLRNRAGALAAAEEQERRLAEARAAAARARLASGGVGALAIPHDYLAVYQQAATTCPGMDWPLLAAVGQVESGHGRNTGPSSAGAIGPMQFMPATFAAYAVDGNGDGVRDAWDYRDAIYTAAAYLCRSGARGGTPEGIHRALLAYNHAEWYVDLVLGARASIAAAQAG